MTLYSHGFVRFHDKVNTSGLQNFKKGMAVLILALANYLRDIVSSGGPTMFKARRKMFGFLGFLDGWKMHFPAPWTYQCAKAPHFPYYVPQNTHSPSSLKKPTPLPVQLPIKNMTCWVGKTIYSKKLQQKFFFLRLCCFINFE